MANRISKNIVLPKSAFREREGIVIIPLKKWKEIEEALEDLEMYRSKTFVKAIATSRQEVKRGETISLKELEKKLTLNNL